MRRDLFWKNHSRTFSRSVLDMELLEEDYHGEFTDAGMTQKWYSAYIDTPSKEECDKLCAELSGEVIIYNRYP